MLPVNDGLVLRLNAEFGPVAVAGTVSGWADLSESGNALSLVSGAPKLHTDVLNGHDVVMFDGVDDALGSDQLAGFAEGSADRTVFLIGSYQSGGAGGFAYGNPSANEAFGVQVNDEGTLTVDASGQGADFVSPNNVVASGWLMQSVVVESGQFTHYLNGNVIDQQSHDFATDNQLVRLGSTLDGSSHAAMGVAEILVYNRALSSAERMQLETHLLDNYLPELGSPAPTIELIDVEIDSETDPFAIHYLGLASSLDANIRYRWTFGDGQQAFGAFGTHTYTERGRYTVQMYATDVNGTTQSSPVFVDVGTAPEVTITSPLDGTTFRGGDVIEYSAVATDPDGSLSDGSYRWDLYLVQNGILRPGPFDLPDGPSGSFTVPQTGRALNEDSAYRLMVTVTDDDGISTKAHVTLQAETVNVTIVSSPSGIPVQLDRVPTETPHVQNSLVGFRHELTANPSYCLAGVRHIFQGWSIGASTTRILEVPAQDTIVVANYLEAGTCGVGEPGDGLVGQAGMDLAGRAGSAWWVSVSTGTEFVNEPWGTWDGNAIWRDVQVADVDGDGVDDIVGRRDGTWVVAKSQGDHFVNETWGEWNNAVPWQHVLVGDFNGDGSDDIAGYTNGRWWVARSENGSFVNERWAIWSATADWRDITVGDFNGDGMDDLAGRTNGNWWVAVSDGARFNNQRWGSWPGQMIFQDVHAADLNGDGNTDLLGRTGDTWWVAISDGTQFQSAVWGGWPAGMNWQDVLVGDFNGDGKDDVAGRADGVWWIAESTGTEFSSSEWGRWGNQVTWQNVMVGDVNADGRDDLLGRTNGRWWVALSTGDELVNVLWTRWSNTANWQNVLLGNFTLSDRSANSNSADFDRDGDVDDADIDLLSQAVRDQSTDPRFDMNGDQVLSASDRDIYITTVLNTVPGDSNLDGKFTTQDLVLVFQRGLYERPQAGVAGWADGDWNGDGLFNSRDLVHAMVYGAFTTESFPIGRGPAELEPPGSNDDQDEESQSTETEDAAASDPISDSALDLLMADGEAEWN
jgi:hypothetical protein